MPQIKITFEWDGETVHKETTGFKGKDCESVTAFIEKCLGGKDIKRKRKESYYVTTDTNKLRRPQLDSGLSG
jgi:hypothetical protein